MSHTHWLWEKIMVGIEQMGAIFLIADYVILIIEAFSSLQIMKSLLRRSMHSYKDTLQKLWLIWWLISCAQVFLCSWAQVYLLQRYTSLVYVAHTDCDWSIIMMRTCQMDWQFCTSEALHYRSHMLLLHSIGCSVVCE